MTQLEKDTQFDALQWAECRKMPKKDDGKNVWIRAIALVAKNDGSKSYCIIERRYTGDLQVVKDFGHSAAIKVYLSVHPYEFVKEKYIKKFGADATKELKVRYVNTMMGKNIDPNVITDEQLAIELINVAIYKQTTSE